MIGSKGLVKYRSEGRLKYRSEELLKCCAITACVSRESSGRPQLSGGPAVRLRACTRASAFLTCLSFSADVAPRPSALRDLERTLGIDRGLRPASRCRLHTAPPGRTRRRPCSASQLLSYAPALPASKVVDRRTGGSFRPASRLPGFPASRLDQDASARQRGGILSVIAVRRPACVLLNASTSASSFLNSALPTSSSFRRSWKTPSAAFVGR